VKGARSKPRPPARSPRGAAPRPQPRKVAAPAVHRPPLAPALAAWTVGLLLFLPPFLVSASLQESFRLPKLLVSEGLGLLSLLFLSWRLRQVERVRPADLGHSPAVRAVLPLLVVATAGIWTTDHPHHLRQALADLWIGAACLVGWSLGLTSRRLQRLLAWLLAPAAALALLGILQYHKLFQPLALLGVRYDPRLAITSTAGNPGDLGAYLVLPCLLAQWLLIRRDAGRFVRWGAAATLALGVYAILLTQTLAALAALALGSVALWLLLLPRRRALALSAGGAVLAVALAFAVPPLRERLVGKVDQALRGDWNAVLTGRFDGWRTAAWMLSEHPWTGVGHGAYLPEFAPAKLALLEQGVQFYPGQVQTIFANAHNEILEAGAEWGLPGLVALAWALWVLIAGLRRISPGPERALAWAGATALAVLSLVHFPFRLALVAFPALLFFAWVLRAAEEAAP
jgi:O-antigen ligase